MNASARAVALLGGLLLTTGCQIDSRQQVLATDKSAVELRAMSTRVFDTSNKNLTVRNVIATLQDLGFVVDKVDETLGTISGTKLEGYVMRMTVTVRPRGQPQMVVRANGQYNMEALSDPRPYQQFFDALSKAMFLAAHNID